MRHLKILRTLNILMGILSLLVGALCLLLYLVLKQIDFGDFGLSNWLFGGLGIVSFLLLLFIGLCHIVIGYLVGTGRARWLQTFLAAAQCTTFFPLGTVYALYAGYVCWLNQDARKAFESALKPPVT